MKALLPICLVALCTLISHADVAATIAQGDQFDKSQQPDQALKFYNVAERETPNDGSLLIKIARQYSYRINLQRSNPEKIAAGRLALAYSERAVKAAPNDSDAHLSVAISLGKLTAFLSNRESIESSRRIKTYAETAARLNPKNDYAWHILGRWNQALAEIGGASRLVAKVIYGGLPTASNEEALKCFQKAIALKPERLIHSIELGRTYAQMGNKEEARKWLQKGLNMANREFDDPETKQRGRKTLAEL